jgi:hypothetical protein
MANGYYYSMPVGYINGTTYSVGNTAITLPPYKPSEQDIKDTASRIYWLVVDFGPQNVASLLQHCFLDPAENQKKLFEAAMDLIRKDSWLLFDNSISKWKIWPANFCKKCKSEIKQRELYLSTYFGCMC